MTNPQQALKELVEKWRNFATTFEITCGDSEVEAAYFGCADELERLAPLLERKVEEARLDEANLWKDRWHMSDADVDWRKQRIAELEKRP